MRRIRESGLLQTLVAGREDLIERLLRPEEFPAEEERKHERAGRTEPAPLPPPPSARPIPAPGIRQILASRRSLRQAMIVSEVLGPPKALRPE